MEFLLRVILLATCIGVAPVRKIMHFVKGARYIQCGGWLIVVTFHVANIMMMIFMFEWYIQTKSYYHPIRLFQVTVLMYIEIGQASCSLFCSVVFRLHRRLLPHFINQCLDVAQDLEGTPVPWLVRHGGPLALLLHTLLTIYRTKGSTVRPKMMIFFWIGINYEIMAQVLMYTSLSLVDLSFCNVNKELQLIINHRLRENSEFLNSLLIQIRERYSRAANLRAAAEDMFGPDMLCVSFFFVFKISFQCYHIYFRNNLIAIGQNSLVGEFSGFFITAEILVFTFYLISVCDNISTKKDDTYVLLMSILTSRIEKSEVDSKNIVKAFILEVKSRKNEFDVCKHFTFNKELFYNMILEAVTYIYMLIQLHGLTV